MIKIWVIYAKPSDFPEWNFVMREHHIKRTNGDEKRIVIPTERHHCADTIEDLRRRIPHGKQRALRTEGDEPQIVEWWF